MTVTLTQLAQRFKGKVQGNGDLVIEDVAPLDKAGPHHIAFLSGRKYYKHLAGTRAGAVILTPADAVVYSGTALLVENPHACFARVVRLLHPLPSIAPGIHPTAVIACTAEVASSAWIGPHSVVEEGAVIGEGTHVGPGCFIGETTVIGDRCRIYANVVINRDCVIGNDCILHPGAVIGSDGFGYARDGVDWIKVPQLGRVILGDRVEIGANTTVDRGALADTEIGDGVKLDNLIQIAHNVKIGEHTAMAALTGVAGNAVIGKRCTVGGRAGILGHLEVSDDVHVAATSLVTATIPRSGSYSSALKAEPAERWRKSVARLNQLDGIARRLRALERKLEKLAGEHET